MWSNRFSNKLEECIHLVLALMLSNVYEYQKHELLDNYGNDTLEQAYNIVLTDYKQIIERITK